MSRSTEATHPKPRGCPFFYSIFFFFFGHSLYNALQPTLIWDHQISHFWVNTIFETQNETSKHTPQERGKGVTGCESSQKTSGRCEYSHLIPPDSKSLPKLLRWPCQSLAMYFLRSSEIKSSALRRNKESRSFSLCGGIWDGIWSARCGWFV